MASHRSWRLSPSHFLCAPLTGSYQMTCPWVHWCFLVLGLVCNRNSPWSSSVRWSYFLAPKFLLIFYVLHLFVELLFLFLYHFPDFLKKLFICVLCSSLLILRRRFWISCQFMHLHFFGVSYWQFTAMLSSFPDPSWSLSWPSVCAPTAAQAHSKHRHSGEGSEGRRAGSVQGCRGRREQRGWAWGCRSAVGVWAGVLRSCCPGF